MLLEVRPHGGVGSAGGYRCGFAHTALGARCSVLQVSHLADCCLFVSACACVHVWMFAGVTPGHTLLDLSSFLLLSLFVGLRLGFRRVVVTSKRLDNYAVSYSMRTLYLWQNLSVEIFQCTLTFKSTLIRYCSNIIMQISNTLLNNILNNKW